MKNVLDLQVPGSALETLWQHESQPPLQMPICLEELYAYECVKLKSMPGSLQRAKLPSLNVSRCSLVEEMPSMEALVCLEELWANGCVKLKGIRGLAQLTKLRLLDVSGCSELEELLSMESLTSLQESWAGGCVKLKGFGRICRSFGMQIVCSC